MKHAEFKLSRVVFISLFAQGYVGMASVSFLNMDIWIKDRKLAVWWKHPAFHSSFT